MRACSLIWYLIKARNNPFFVRDCLQLPDRNNLAGTNRPQVIQMKKLLLIIMALHLSVLEAAADTNLYSGEVVVPSQSEADRKEAIPEALIQVLQKLSGQREMPLSPALDDALDNADRSLISFQYVNTDRAGPDGAVSRELRLLARFMRPEVDRIVRQLGLPRWQQERPAVQIWVVIDDGGKRKLKPLEFDYAWDSLQDIAAMRGLPVSWPELDEEELQLIDMRLVWGGYTDYLVERGAPADGVAIVAARREGPLWTLRWNLASGEQNWNWRTDDQELMFALAQGIHYMTDMVAASDIITVSEQGASVVDVTISELNNAADYAACLGYLQDLSLVTAVEILAANPGRVHFRLQLNASSEHLSEAFDRGSVLLRSRNGIEYEYEFLP